MTATRLTSASDRLPVTRLRFLVRIARADERTMVGTTRCRFTRFVDHVSLAAAPVVGAKILWPSGSPVRFTFRSTDPRTRPSRP